MVEQVLHHASPPIIQLVDWFPKINMFGFINIHKPVGPTSHDIVNQVRLPIRKLAKVGHAGTLDPFASGVLVVCVGPAVRLAEYVQRQPKRYTAQITLGATSDTDDITGQVLPSAKFEVRSAKEEVEDVLKRFVGVIQQIPPAHSAVHVAGRRAYQLAREGETLHLPPRPVTIHDIQLLRYDWPVVEIDVHCGSGTYIRSIARDVGEALGVGGYCSALVRTAVGPFTLDNAVPLEDVNLTRDLLPATMALDIPLVYLDDEQAGRIRYGKTVTPSAGAEMLQAEEVALLDPSGHLLALAKPDEMRYQPTKVFDAI